ncbi:MAG: tetratricopeptide repeat protein [Candidatus Hermodarchaeota archaeon]
MKNRLQLLDASLIMAESLVWLNQEEKALEVLSNNEDVLFEMIDLSSKELARKKVAISFIKGLIYESKGELDTSMDHLKHSLKIGEEYGLERNIARCLNRCGFIIALKGDLDRALEYAKRGLALEEDHFNRNISRSYATIGTIYLYKGDLDNALDYNKQGLVIAEKLNSKRDIAGFLNNIGGIYQQKGDLFHAQEYLKRSLEIWESITSSPWKVLDSLFHVALDMNDLEQARQYLMRLKQIKDQGISELSKLVYRMNKAIMLKTNLRAINRGRAEKILKHCLKETFDFDFLTFTLLNLCDLLLIDLRITSDLEILEELQSFITQLLDIAEKSRSHLLLAETYLLQARLSLIVLNIKEARRFLTQAQQIAERHNYKLLAMKVSNEQEKLLKQLDVWEKLKESNAPLTERMKLAHIEDQIQGMLHNRMSFITHMTIEKISVHKERKVCLVCKGDIERFNIYICPECNTIYCQNCAKTLIDLENLCWGCNTPINPSKPIKPYEKEEGIEISSENDIKTPKK